MPETLNEKGLKIAKRNWVCEIMGGADIGINKIMVAKAEMKREKDIDQIKLQLKNRDYNGLGTLKRRIAVNSEIFWKESKSAIKNELADKDANFSDARYLMHLFGMSPKMFIREANAALGIQIESANKLVDQLLSTTRGQIRWVDKPYHNNILILVKDFEADTTRFQKVASNYYEDLLTVTSFGKQAREISELFLIYSLRRDRNTGGDRVIC